MGTGFQIGPVMIPWYGFFIVLGIAAAMLLGYILVKRNGLDFDRFIQIACFVGLGAMVGAKILYLIVAWEQIDFSRITDPEYLNMLMGSGFVFYGGLIGGLIGLTLCGKILHIPVAEYARLTIPVIPVAHAFGRIGCAFVGCCYGVPYSGWGAVTYTDSLFAPNGISLFPVQAAEAVLELVIAAVLCAVIFRAGRSDKKPRSIELYLVLYAVMRFGLEFFRYDDAERGILAGMSTSQWISLGVCVGAAVYYVAGYHKKTSFPR